MLTSDRDDTQPKSGARKEGKYHVAVDGDIFPDNLLYTFLLQNGTPLLPLSVSRLIRYYWKVNSRRFVVNGSNIMGDLALTLG